MFQHLQYIKSKMGEFVICSGSYPIALLLQPSLDQFGKPMSFVTVKIIQLFELLMQIAAVHKLLQRLANNLAVCKEIYD